MTDQADPAPLARPHAPERPSRTLDGPRLALAAIRIGPGLMPRWNERTIPADDADAVAAYLVWLRDNADEGGLQLGRVGAVAEGLIAMVIGLGLILLVIRLTRAKA